MQRENVKSNKTHPPKHVQEETENLNAHFMIQNLKSHIDNCHFKTEEDKQKFAISIENQKKRIEEFHKIQDSRIKSISEAEYENATLKQEVQYAQKALEELNLYMMDTRSACMQLKEMCTPIATDLITCSKYKEHVQSFQKEVSSKVTELKETLSSLKNKCEQKKLNWKEQACKLKVLKETQKKELVEAVEKVRNLKDEVKLKRVTLHLKNNAIEQRIDEKKTEMEVVNNNLKKELQKIRELMLKEKKKHEELNALSDQHNKNVLKMESSLLDVKNETDLQKNMLTDLKIKIANRGEENKKSEEELVRVKSKIADLDSKKRDVENFIQENNAIELKLTSELKLIREEYDALKQTHDNISDSYSKKLEAITALKAEIQEKQQQHETLVAENTIKIGDVMKQLQEGRTELLNVNSELVEVQETIAKLHTSLTEKEDAKSSLKLEIETLDKQIAESNKTRKYSETLAKQLLEDNKNSTEELTSVQATLHELQESLSAAKLKKEEFQIHSTRQKRELEQELMNVQREQQTSATNSDWILQQTETCVKACKENYAQQVKEKEIMLAALKDESQSLNKEIEDALKENVDLVSKKKEQKNSLDDSVKMLELELANRKMGAISMEAEDSVDEQSASRILKPSSLERLKNKRVQFQGLGSDSDASLIDAETLMSKTKQQASSFPRKKTSSEDANRKFFKKRTS